MYFDHMTMMGQLGQGDPKMKSRPVMDLPKGEAVWITDSCGLRRSVMAPSRPDSLFFQNAVSFFAMLEYLPAEFLLR